LSGIRPLKVVVDAANGMGGMVAQAVLGTAAGLPGLPLEITGLFMDPDGRFPNHPANPLDPANLVDLQAAVVAQGADIGLAFDGDADRCFMVDEQGGLVPPSVIGTIIALSKVAQERSSGREAVVVVNAITSRALAETVQAAGGRAVTTPVGHADIKPDMAQHDAVYGAEHSGHYYFRDFFYADTGIFTAMHVLAVLGQGQAELSELADMYGPYAASGELNFKVADIPTAIQRVEQAYSDDVAAGTVQISRLDGLTLSHWGQVPRWWANVRASNTESVLSLNVEAADDDIMAKVRDGLVELLRED
jgi:phosphomannomutase